MVHCSRIIMMVKYVKQRKSRIYTCVSLLEFKISRISPLNQLKKPLHTIKNAIMHRTFNKNCDFHYVLFYFMANIFKICKFSNETIGKNCIFRCFTPFTSPFTHFVLAPIPNSPLHQRFRCVTIKKKYRILPHHRVWAKRHPELYRRYGVSPDML